MSDDIIELVQPFLRQAPPYVPVTPPEKLAQRLGVPVEGIIKLDANENPYGSSPKALRALAASSAYNIYPDPEQTALRKAFGGHVGYNPAWIMAGAGSDELIELLVRMFVPAGEAILNFPPTFGMYPFLADVLGGRTVNVTRRDDYSLDIDAALKQAVKCKLIFAVSPNNPTGTPITAAELDALLATGKPVVVDEAYAEFSGQSFVERVRNTPNLIVLRTLSKWAGLAGLRVGYMVAQPSLVELAMRIKQPYSVSVAAEVASLASFEDLDLLQQRVGAIIEERARLAALLGSLPGFEVVPSASNFILCRLGAVEAREVYERLLQRGIMVRYYDNPLLKNHIRVSVGKPEQTDALVLALREILSTMRPGVAG